MTKARTAQRKGGNQAPISAHPAFPAIVALWFAALFGIGSMVLPNILIEKIVDATGITTIIPAAAPPIGFTAKLTLAAVAAVLGVVAGIFVARKVVESQTAPKPARSARKTARQDELAPAKRPIVATEELGEEGLGPVDDDDSVYAPEPQTANKPPLPGRRRALSVTDDSGPSEYLAHVPLPGEGGFAAEVNPTPSAQPLAPEMEFAVADPANRRDGSNVVPESIQDVAEQEHSGALESLRNPASDSGVRPFDLPVSFPADASMGGDGADYQAGSSIESSHDTHAPLQLGMAQEEETMSTSEHGFAASYNPFGDRPFEQPASPPASEAPRQMFGMPQEGAATFAPAAAAPAQEFATQAFTPTSFAAPAKTVAAPAAPLAELSMSELIARFARSMQGDTVATATAPAASDDPFEDAAAAVPFAFASPVEAAPAQASEAPMAPVEMPPFAAPAAPVQPFAEPAAATASAAVPAALRPLDLSEFEEEDSDDPFAATPGFSFGVPERMFERPAEAAPAFAPAPVSAPAPAPEPQATPVAAPAAQPTFAAPAPDSFSQPVSQSFTQPAAPGLPAAFTDPLATAAEEDAGTEDDGNEEAYSSLLSMKSPLGNHREFPRVEEDEEPASATRPEAVVVFPGQQAPATNAARPFDAPAGAVATGGLARAVPTMPAQKPADPAETERALREALEKLQRMSGAA